MFQPLALLVHDCEKLIFTVKTPRGAVLHILRMIEFGSLENVLPRGRMAIRPVFIR